MLRIPFGLSPTQFRVIRRRSKSDPSEMEMTAQKNINGVNVVSQIGNEGAITLSAETPLMNISGSSVKFAVSKKGGINEITGVAEYALRTANVAAKASIDGSRVLGSLVLRSGPVVAGVRSDFDSLYQAFGDADVLLRYEGGSWAITASQR
eukprot:CAMPEP_0113670516 /NCGR_PEP_ID=MMETSP0038_2-20120614/5182_1 /TAXON_ID=2898 /ORGANISM="Cryptomonas paramecium" /LENGTH=150 /DNA_ID=CAMNT_0000586545 /DNA_START=213 /DNA_END=662 /DNA_ORIENTATION=- /assembly_acc=CAM_ASM_000170